MALFKLFKGSKDELSRLTKKTEGYAYFTTEDKLFHVDTSDTQRMTLNAKKLINEAGVEKGAEDFTSVAYNVTLAVSGWTDSGSGDYIYNYSNSALKCGENGDVPPVITYTSNKKEYGKITDNTLATPGVGIVFHCSVRPTEDIGIIIIDVK